MREPRSSRDTSVAGDRHGVVNCVSAFDYDRRGAYAVVGKQ
jgi:hypothetical protein